MKSGNLTTVPSVTDAHTPSYERQSSVTQDARGHSEFYPPLEVLRGWREYLNRSAAVYGGRWKPLDVKSNCPTAPAKDIIPTMWCKVEIFFYRNIGWLCEYEPAKCGQASNDFLAAFEGWYAIEPIPLPEGAVSDEYVDMVDIVDRWNGMYPGDQITYDALRKAKSEKRLGYRVIDGRTQCSMADIALWRSQHRHGGKREGAGRKAA